MFCAHDARKTAAVLCVEAVIGLTTLGKRQAVDNEDGAVSGLGETTRGVVDVARSDAIFFIINSYDGGGVRLGEIEADELVPTCQGVP